MSGDTQSGDSERTGSESSDTEGARTASTGPGALAGEAARLFRAIAEAAGPSTPVSGPTTGQPDAEHPVTCTWCPVCRGVESLRAVDPAAVDRLGEAVTLLADALGELAGHLKDRLPNPSAAAPGASPASGARSSYGGSGTTAPGAAVDIPVLDEEED